MSASLWKAFLISPPLALVVTPGAMDGMRRRGGEACAHAGTSRAGGLRTERLIVVRREQHVADVAERQPTQFLSQHLVCTRRALARRRALLLLLLLLPPLLLLLMGMLPRVKVTPLLPLAPLPPLARAALVLALVALRLQQCLQQRVQPRRNQEDDLLKLAAHLPRRAASRCAPRGRQGPPAEP